MAYFKLQDKKLLFVHIPKTGGRALATQLRNFGYFKKSDGAHIRIWEIEDWQNYHSFCIVRHPYERAQSFYRHFYQEKIEPYNVHKKTFLEFVKNMPNTFHSKSQTYWVSKDDKIIVDTIIKYENYSKEVIPFLKEHDVVVDFIEEFKSSDKSIECELTDEIKDILYNEYKEDFDNFNYNP